MINPNTADYKPTKEVMTDKQLGKFNKAIRKNHYKNIALEQFKGQYDKHLYSVIMEDQQGYHTAFIYNANSGQFSLPKVNRNNRGYARAMHKIRLRY